MTLIIILFLIATTLVIAEVMFPSFGILGLLAATAFLIAILEAFDLGQTAGYISIVTAIILVPCAFGAGVQLLKYSPVGNKLLLEGPASQAVSGQGANLELKNLLGRSGVTTTPLRPIGFVDIDGRRVDAVSEDGFLDPGVAVRIVHVEGNRVVAAAVSKG